MIAKQAASGGASEPGEFSDNDKAILAQADAMLGTSRNAMATQQITSVAERGLGRGRGSQPMFLREAPWALAKTDTVRQKTVLYVTAEVPSGRHSGAAGDAEEAPP